MQRWLFLVLFIYAVLYIIPFPFTFVGVLPSVGNFFNEYFWDILIPWTGKVILGLEGDVSVVRGGSGDSTYFWIQALLLVVLSLVGGSIWFLIGRHRINYGRLLHWLLVYITYFLIFSMIVYGMVKVIKLQFPDPRLTRLLQPYGESSPMGIAWTFMGASDSYTFFAGLSEVIAAFLLLFKRTRTMGAVFAFGVVLNIFTMNMSYDIPVKLYSFHLLLIALSIMFIDRKRLINLFLLNKGTEPLEFSEHTSNHKWNKGITIAKFVLFAAFFGSTTYDSLEAQSLYGKKVPLPPLYGIYDVIHFEVNGETKPPLLTDSLRWRRLLIEKGDYAIVQPMYDNSTTYHSISTDTLEMSMTIKSFQDSTNLYDFKYVINADSIFLHGMNKADTLELTLLKYDLSNFELINRGFHWINEYPHNR